MDIRKQKYLSANKYIAKISTIPSEQEKVLFTKYSEPIIEVGGTMTDGNTSFVLTEDTRSIYFNSPISQTFDPLTLGINYIEAGVRADIFIDTIIGRIETEILSLRELDSTNFEFDRTIVI